MEDPLNRSAPEATGERVHKSAWQTDRLRSVLGEFDQPSEHLLPALGPTGLASERTLEHLRSVLSAYDRPSQQRLSALNAYPLDTGTSFQKMMDDILGPHSALAGFADLMTASRNSLSILGGIQNSKTALGSMDAALAAVNRSMAPAIKIADLQKSMDGLLGGPYSKSAATSMDAVLAAVNRSMVPAIKITDLQKSMDGLLGGPSTYSIFANSMASLQAELGRTDSIVAQIANIRRSMTVGAGMPALGANFHKSLFGLVAPPVAFPKPFEPFAPLIEEFELVGLTLDELGYFFWRLLPLGIIIRYCRLAPAIQSDGVIVTNMLLDITSSDEFAKNLESIFLNSPILRRRWPNIADSLHVHRSGIYSQTVRNLLAEIEGILGDMLVEEGLALDIEGKIYRMGDSQKQKELKGLGEIAGQAQHSELQENEDFRKFRKYAEKKLAPKFHPTRHGRVIDYHTADLSSRLILYIHGLAATISGHFKGK